MAENTLQTPNNQAAETRTPPVTRDENRYQFPPVDIFETNGDLTVVADLPGVEKDGLNVRVDEDGVLTIEGRVQHIDKKSNAINEYDLVDYFRQFRLSEEIDREGISAELKHGVLTLKLPKAQAAKPRQIEVKVA
ncbi:Hsp20/alpha crystallin family protein [bacterium]|nr:Hsp20/alpha crystallin family protein [bacterium]